MQELKTIEGREFMANGVKYFIESKISFERFSMYQKLQMACAFGVEFYQMYEAIEKIYNSADKMKLNEVVIISHNILNGIKTYDQRPLAALQLCAMFINSEDEDRRIINDDMVDKKIKDWQSEGLDITPFFQLAASSMRNFAAVYDSFTLDSLKEEKKESSITPTK